MSIQAPISKFQFKITAFSMDVYHAINILEECTISPPPCSVSAISLPLTFFDIKWLHLPPPTLIFFYEFHHSKDYFINTILPNLKNSLSVTLQHFFPYAGNLVWRLDSKQPEIQYIDGDSVSFTVCESSYDDFHHLSGNHPKEANLLFPLLPQLVNRSGERASSLLAISITLFANKGISIGFTQSHSSGDGRTFFYFLKVWALVSKLHGDASFVEESPVCYDRSLVSDPNGNTMILLDHFEKCNITKETFNIPRARVVPIGSFLATFRLSGDDIKLIKQVILTGLSQKREAASAKISTFVSVCAYVWGCLVKARWGEGIAAIEDDPMEYFIFQADSRARLHPPLPDTYFGNCLTSAVVECKRSDLIGKDGIWIAAELFMNAIQNIDNEDKITKSMETFYSAPDRVVTVAGSPKFGSYETDFGWGNPKKMDITSIAGTGAVSLSGCPNEKDAVEVGLGRKKIEMDAFASLFVKTVQCFR